MLVSPTRLQKVLSGRRRIVLAGLAWLLAVASAACSAHDDDGSSAFPLDAAEVAIALAAQGFSGMSRDVSHDHVSDDGMVETIRTLVVPDRFDAQRVSDELGESFLVVNTRPTEGPFWRVEGTSQLNSPDGSTVYKVTLSDNNGQVYFAGSQFFGIDGDGLVVSVEAPPGVFPTTVVS